ncbi:hypothetical protein UlMin_016364 [Ulmus minor]
MGNFKAPGPDGMTSLFYKSYWQTVGGDVIALVQEFFRSNRLLPELNYSNIFLIPKTDKPTSMNHYKPISVCNLVYKVIAKLLADRIKPLLHDLICPTQGAFVSGRSIHDNSFIIQEVIHSMKKKSGQVGYVAMKIDLQKAYDRLNWEFLFAVLKAFGFHDRWIGWVRSCVSSVSMNLLLNGSVFGSFRPKRGLRGLIRGLKVSRAAPAIHHLLFADDIFLLGKASTLECSQFKECLDTFLKDFSYLLDRLDSNLAGWKMKLLSCASRLILIKYVGLALPIYSMQSTCLPRSICFKMDSKVRQFWWGSRSDSSRALCLCSWSAICAPKALGGLGFRRFADMNKALLWSCKQIGDDFSTRIWDDPWIPTTDSFRVTTSGAASFGLFLVSDLILPSRMWDERKIRCCFNLVDVENILKIPLPIQPRPDRWVWTFTKNGNFSAKSAYLADQHQQFLNLSTLPRDVWLRIWNSRILPRHKLLWWQLLNDFFPTRLRLNRLFSISDLSCVICKYVDENIIHLLFHCDFSRRLWLASPWTIHPDPSSFSSALDCVHFIWQCDEIAGNHNEEIWLFASILLDSIWRIRNSVLHGNTLPNPSSSYQLISKSFTATMNALKPNSLPLVSTWSPPLEGWTKINFDAATCPSFLVAAAVVRDWRGKVIKWQVRELVTSDPLEAEAVALEIAISLAIQESLINA